jgi:hypothetical protein
MPALESIGCLPDLWTFVKVELTPFGFIGYLRDCKKNRGMRPMQLMRKPFSSTRSLIGDGSGIAAVNSLQFVHGQTEPCWTALS